jgi:rod shape determining protein RodA
MRAQAGRGSAGYGPQTLSARRLGGIAEPERPGLLRRVWQPGSPLRELDWIMLAAVVALSGIGAVLVWSASAAAQQQFGGNPRAYLYKQVLNIVIGLIVMAAVTTLNIRQLRSLAPAAYIAALLGLLAVYSPLGETINGGRSWIRLPAGFQLEPAEYAKLALVLVSAALLTHVHGGDGRPRPRDAALAIICAAPIFALVIKEPALGMAIVLALILIALLVLSGLKLRWLAVLAGLAGVGIYGVAHLHLLKPYQVQRLSAFLHPTADPLGSGWQALQARIAMGSGGVTGQGLFHGAVISGGFLGAEQQSDFIYAVVGEELGFAGAVAIIVLLSVVVLRALRIAARADDTFGMLVAAGIAVWFAIQATINIGMTVGLVPVTGLPLPFVSYGGSSMFANMLAVGALQVVRRRRRLFGYG